MLWDMETVQIHEHEMEREREREREGRGREKDFCSSYMDFCFMKSLFGQVHFLSALVFVRAVWGFFTIRNIIAA